MDFSLDSNLKKKNSSLFAIPTSNELSEIKKFIFERTNEGFTTPNVRSSSLYLSKNILQEIASNQQKWAVGLTNIGYECFLIVLMNSNYIYNTATNSILVLNTFLIDPKTYNNSIIIGTFTKTDENEYIFIGEDTEIFKDQDLSLNTYKERYEKLFELNFNKGSNITFSIMYLYSIQYIKSLMNSLIIPYKTNGLSFYDLSRKCCLNQPNDIIWKRTEDHRLYFNIRKSLTTNDKDFSVDFILRNCKKPSFTTSNQSYIQYDNKIVEAFYYNNAWVITKQSLLPASQTTTYKAIVTAVKDNISLEEIYNSLLKA